MDIGKRMKERRKQLKMTADEIGEKLGVSRATIYRYEKGDIEKFPIESLEPLAEALQTTNEYLMGWEFERDILPIYKELTPQRQIKVYNFAEKQLDEQNNIINVDFAKEDSKTIITNRRTAAGSALHVDDTDARKEVVSSALIPKGADELVEVVGKSMEPLIKDGQEVYMRYQPSVENGEIAIVRIENEGVTCKRVYADNGTITLKSENEEYDDMHFDASQVVVLGKVLL